METENWIQYFTNKEEYGKEIPYYFNKTTKVTQWEEPEEMEYYFYAKPEQKDCSPNPVTLPENYITMDYRSVFQLIGIDSISSLKHNSIRKLQIYHQNTLQSLDWAVIASQSNGLLLYVLSSQFYNSRSCFEEIVACADEFVEFASAVDIAIPIFFDSRFGGVNKFITCMKYLKWDYAPFVPIFDLVAPYLPFNQDLLDTFQKNISESSLHCAIHYSQNNVNSFVKSIIYPDQFSSIFVSILNSTSLNSTFAWILWQFASEALKLEEHLLYASDFMVLIDILIRYLHDLPTTNQFTLLFRNILKNISQSTVYKVELNQYKWKEVQLLFVNSLVCEHTIVHTTMNFEIK